MIRRILTVLIFWLSILPIGCASSPTPYLEPRISTPSQFPVSSRTITPSLSFGFVTPTLGPTNTPIPIATPLLPNNSAAALPTSSSPKTLGNTLADSALVDILQACWGVTDMRVLNGQIPAHVSAFDCARASLLKLAVKYPEYPEVHRLLAWGYYYKDNNPGNSASEYRNAANLYKLANDRVGESEARMRLGLLLVISDKSAACTEFATATNLNQQNVRAIQYSSAYQCDLSQKTTGDVVPTPLILKPVDLIGLRGKIVFKSDRGGFEQYYVVDSDGKNLKKLDDPRVYLEASKWESFSPDRKQVAIVRLEGFDSQLGGDNNDIWVTDPSGGSGRPLSNPHNDYDPVWSPIGLFDGQTWLAFVSNRGDLPHPGSKGDNIWLMHPDGTTGRRVTCYPDYRFAKHPTFSGDATKIAFYSDLLGKARIFVADIAGMENVADLCTIGANATPITPASDGQFGDTEPIWIK